MITKETFVSTMDTLRKQYHQEEAIVLLLQEMTDRDGCNFDVSDKIVSCLIKVLEDMFDDRFGWICWFIYEKDFGEKKLRAYDVNKKGIKLNTAAQLYDFLIKEMN